MKNTLKKISFLLCSTLALHAGEFEYGHGTINMTGGFIGLDSTISADIATYSLVEHHKNILSSTWYYKYNLTWYDSDTMVQGQNTLNSSIATANTALATTGTSAPTIPSIDYRLQGLDVNLVLGKDIYHKNENTFFGIGLLVGVSLPWIDSSKSDSNDDDTSDDLMDAMKDSKTEMLTYKIGPSISASASLNKHFMVYASAIYAYQTGTLKNDYADSDLNVDGIFQEYDVGLKIQPFSEDYKTSLITLSPRLYGTLGYRYTEWTLDDVAIDVTGTGQTFTQTDFSSDNSVVYFGIGYDFF
jgi:hypothetical protein